MSYELIETVEVGAAGASSIEFTSIPQDGTDLVLVVSGRTDNSSPPGLQATINNDTGTNYEYVRLESDGGTEGSLSNTSTFLYIGNDNSSTTTSNTFSSTNAYFSNYTSTSGISVSSETVSADNADWGDAELGIYANQYSGSSACTSLQVFLSGSSNFVQYTTASLYKITAA